MSRVLTQDVCNHHNMSLSSLLGAGLLEGDALAWDILALVGLWGPPLGAVFRPGHPLVQLLLLVALLQL